MSHRRVGFVIIDQFRKSHLSMADLHLRGLSNTYKLRHKGIVEAHYVPNVTPVGHATLSFGCVPHAHGIHARHWARWKQGQLERVQIDHLFSGPNDKQPDNLCHHLRDLGFRTAVATAKDFVTHILGGDDADVYIYPVLRSAASIYHKHLWSLCIGHSGRVDALAVPNLLDRSRNMLADLLAKLGQPQSIAAAGRIGAGLYAFDFELDSNILKTWSGCAQVDTFYSELLRAAWEVLLTDGDSAIIQSMFACDQMGHLYGASNEYDQALVALCRTAEDLLLSCRNINEWSAFVVTGDHGGRDTSAAHDVPLSHPCRKNWQYSSIEDCVFNYEKPTQMAQVVLHGPPCTALQWSKSELHNSFAPSDMPSEIHVATDTATLFESQGGKNHRQGGGSHGFAIPNRERTDAYTPLLAGVTPPQGLGATTQLIDLELTALFPSQHDKIRDFLSEVITGNLGTGP